jgi:hypothetical protein
MRCPICELEIKIGQNLNELKRVDGKVICVPCLTTFQAIKKMNACIGRTHWKGIRLDAKPYSIFKNRYIYEFKWTSKG